MGNAIGNKEKVAESFISMIADGVKPFPEIKQRFFEHIRNSITDDEKVSALQDALARELGWVMCLSDHEIDVLIEAECIKYAILDVSEETYQKKLIDRQHRMSEKVAELKAKRAED